jgi:hypothetical protein
VSGNKKGQTVYERITATDPAGAARYGHDFRYHLAAGFIKTGYVVVDAACGTGYGPSIMGDFGYDYLGVDLVEPTDLPDEQNGIDWMLADLSNPTDQLFGCVRHADVFIGFETIEHLQDYSKYLELAKQTRRWIAMSAPIVPTKHINPWHLHDFVPGQLQLLLEDEDWEHYQTVQQPSEVSEIVVMRRR